MIPDIRQKLEEIKTQAGVCSRRQASDADRHTFPQTLLLINVVSLFADALEAYCDEQFPGWNPGHKKRLAEILEKLHTEKRLRDFAGCHRLRERRNQCAHAFGTRCDWREVEESISRVETELKHAGII